MSEMNVRINQSVAVLIDGNNIEMSLQTLMGEKSALLDFDTYIPKLLNGRGLKRLIYFREGKSISTKLADRLLNHFHGSVVPCYKSADIPLTIKATQLAPKVDTIIILSGDSDYIELVRHLKGEGVRVEIAAVAQNTAKVIIEEADLFTPIVAADGFVLKSQRSRKSTPKTSAKPTKEQTSKARPKTASKTKSRSSSRKKS